MTDQSRPLHCERLAVGVDFMVCMTSRDGGAVVVCVGSGNDSMSRAGHIDAAQLLANHEYPCAVLQLQGGGALLAVTCIPGFIGRGIAEADAVADLRARLEGAAALLIDIGGLLGRFFPHPGSPHVDTGLRSALMALRDVPMAWVRAGGTVTLFPTLSRSGAEAEMEVEQLPAVCCATITS